MSSENKCIICEGNISASDQMILKRKAIETIIKTSIERGDDKHLSLSKSKEAELHRQCHRAYTSEFGITSAKKRKLLSEDEKNILSQFDYINLCIFCGEDASDVYIRNNLRKGRPKTDLVKLIKLGKSVGLMIDLAQRRNDEKHQMILQRLTMPPNLAAVEAKYHNDCFSYFFDPMSMNPLMTYIETFFDKNSEKRAFSFEEVLEGYHGPQFSYDQIEEKIKLTLGDKIVVSRPENPGEPMLVMSKKNFTDMMCARAQKTLKKGLIIPESEEEQKLILKAAGQMIAKDIDDYVDNHLQDNLFHDPEEDIPSSLKFFLQKLLLPPNATAEQQRKAKNKIIAIAHAIICARRPEAFKSNLQTFLGKYLFDRTGSNEIIDILSALGLSASREMIEQSEESSQDVHDFLVKYQLLSLTVKKQEVEEEEEEVLHGYEEVLFDDDEMNEPEPSTTNN